MSSCFMQVGGVEGFADRVQLVKGKTKVTEEDDEEEELRKLQAEMAM